MAVEARVGKLVVGGGEAVGVHLGKQLGVLLVQLSAGSGRWWGWGVNVAAWWISSDSGLFGRGAFRGDDRGSPKQLEKRTIGCKCDLCIS